MKTIQMSSQWTFAGVLLMATSLSSCQKAEQAAADIRITNAWSRPVQLPAGAGGQPSPMDSGTNGVVYLTIFNKGDLDDSLRGARSGACQKIEIHETVMSDDRMSMKRVDDEIPVPGHGKVEFKPMARHFMLLGMNRSLTIGDSVRVLLSFQKSGMVQVYSRVRLN